MSGLKHPDSLRTLAKEIGLSHTYLSQVRHGNRPPSDRVLPYMNLITGERRGFAQSKSWQEHIRSIQRIDDLVLYHHKVPTEIVIEIKTEVPIGICFTADWHLGMPGVDYKTFEANCETWANTEGLYVYIGGDGYHNIIQASKVGSSHLQVPINVQKGLYVLTLEKLIDKILAIGTGNHNYWTALAEGEDWDGELAKRLKVVYTKHGGKVYLKVGKQIYPILRLHKGRYNSGFNLTHTAKQYQRMFCPDARVVVVEHNHHGAIEQYQYNGKECVAIRPGTYAVYDDWALQNGYFGSKPYDVVTVFYPNEDRIVPLKLEDALVFLKTVRGE